MYILLSNLGNQKRKFLFSIEESLHKGFHASLFCYPICQLLSVCSKTKLTFPILMSNPSGKLDNRLRDIYYLLLLGHYLSIRHLLNFHCLVPLEETLQTYQTCMKKDFYCMIPLSIHFKYGLQSYLTKMYFDAYN